MCGTRKVHLGRCGAVPEGDGDMVLSAPPDKAPPKSQAAAGTAHLSTAERGAKLKSKTVPVHNCVLTN